MTTQFSSDMIPQELAHLPSEARLLAVEIANEGLRDGLELSTALSIAQARAEAWLEGTEQQPIYHVVPKSDGWQVVQSGTNTPGQVESTKQKALDAARTLARKQSTRLIVHGQDGVVQSVHDYGDA